VQLFSGEDIDLLTDVYLYHVRIYCLHQRHMFSFISQTLTIGISQKFHI